MNSLGESGPAFVKSVGDDYATNPVGLRLEDRDSTSFSSLLRDGGVCCVIASDAKSQELGSWHIRFNGQGEKPTIIDAASADLDPALLEGVSATQAVNSGNCPRSVLEVLHKDLKGTSDVRAQDGEQFTDDGEEARDIAGLGFFDPRSMSPTMGDTEADVIETKGWAQKPPGASGDEHPHGVLCSEHFLNGVVDQNIGEMLESRQASCNAACTCTIL